MPGSREEQMRAELAALASMDKATLAGRWAKLTGRPVPHVSTRLLRLALAWELQAKAQGSHARRVRSKIDRTRSVRSGATALRPGMRLVREWNGVVHVVTVNEQSEPVWNGKSWRSLSEIARTITGTRWSGPAFFGLRHPRKAAA
jgi:hypothetical protein